MIDVEGVSKAFRIPTVHRNTVREHVLGIFEPRQFQRLQVLDDVSFSVKQGEALGIMGRNGSGKSTLLKIICGVYQADRGRVVRRAAITPILELGVGWNPELDAVDNVCLIGSVMGLSLGEIRRRMDQILAFAELERFANLKLKHFSSGMAARLGYAVAFEAVHDVLVLDEVFAVGDAGFRAKCEERYRELRASGRTILLVSHAPSIVERFCDRAILIERGHIVCADSTQETSGRYLASLMDNGRAMPGSQHVGVTGCPPPERSAGGIDLTPPDTQDIPKPGRVRMGDLRRTTPLSRTWGFDRGRPIDRYYIEAFLSRHATDIRGRVLEAGTSDYTVTLGRTQVLQADVMNLDGNRPGTTITADLQNAPHIPDDSFDCVVLTQLLQYVFDVDAAIGTVFRILRPGGVLLITVPGIAHTDEVWASQGCWTFTPVSLRRLLGRHFRPELTTVEAHGNVLAASAFLYGLATEELDRSELDVRDPAYDVTIAARAVKN